MVIKRFLIRWHRGPPHVSRALVRDLKGGQVRWQDSHLPRWQDLDTYQWTCQERYQEQSRGRHQFLGQNRFFFQQNLSDLFFWV